MLERGSRDRSGVEFRGRVNEADARYWVSLVAASLKPPSKNAHGPNRRPVNHRTSAAALKSKAVLFATAAGLSVVELIGAME